APRIGFSPRGERHPGDRILMQRQVDLFLRLAIESLVANVANHAHDDAVSMRVLNHLAEGGSVRKIRACHRFVDDACQLSLRLVALVEISSSEEGNPHRLKVTGRNRTNVGQRVFSRRRCTTLDWEWKGRCGGAFGRGG